MRKLFSLALAFVLGFPGLHERALAADTPAANKQFIEQKLDTIPIGEANFSDASLREMVAWLPANQEERRDRKGSQHGHQSR